MEEQKNNYNIYIGTDSNEVIGRLRNLKKRNDYNWEDDYNFTSDLISFEREEFIIVNIPQTLGKEIKNKVGLGFEPISMIHTDQKTRNTSALIRALTQKDIPVAAQNGGELEFYKPSKHLALLD